MIKTDQFISRRLSDSAKSSVSSLIVKISLFSVALSVLVMILATFLISGFKYELHHRLQTLYGDLLISDFNESQAEFVQNPDFYFNPDTLKLISTSENVKATQAYTHQFVMLKYKTSPIGALIKCANFNSQSLENTYLTGGRLPQSSRDSNRYEICISRSMQKSLQSNIGDQLLVYIKSPLDDYIKVRKLTITGIYNSSFAEHDDAVAWMDLSFSRNIMGILPNHWHGINIYVNNTEEIEKTRLNIWDKYLHNPYNIQTTPQRFQYIVDWINMQNINEYLILTIMFFIALVNMISCILILILDRIQMIGVMKSIGSSNQLIQKIFQNLSQQIIWKGLLWGNAIALILAFVQYQFKLIRLPEKYYLISYVPVHFDWERMIFINVLFFILLNLALIIPTWIVKKLSPIQILKYQ